MSKQPTIEDVARLMALIEPGEEITATPAGWFVRKRMDLFQSTDLIERALQPFDLLIRKGRVRVIGFRRKDAWVTVWIDQITPSPWL